MFTEKGKKKRGRPPGPTSQGHAARQRLYDTAVRLIGERGFDETTLRDVARSADVSVGLLYRYFPSKQAIVLALYDQLSAEQEVRAAAMPRGRWRDRFLFTLDASLTILRPHRRTLAALIPVLVSNDADGLFSATTAFSRERVQRIYQDAVLGASDAPREEVAAALGRLLYLVHLAIVLWWLLDKSPEQRATRALVKLLTQALPPAALTLRLPKVGAFILSGDRLFQEALIGAPGTASPGGV
jgi:AcrR family transcriptional regulator